MKSLVYCEGEFGKIDGKVANGLARHSEKYQILGIIDSTKAGLDAGEFLDGIKNGIPIFQSSEDAIETLGFVPDTSSTALQRLLHFLTIMIEGLSFQQ